LTKCVVNFIIDSLCKTNYQKYVSVSFICFVFVQIGVRWELSVKNNNENIIPFFLPLR